MSDFDDVCLKLSEIDGRYGLPEDVFLALSALVPIANVDLLVIDKEKGLLLSWRDDEYYGRGWHLVGGCIRFKETMLERVQKTAVAEIGTTVEVNKTPIAVRDVILNKNEAMPKLRAHHLAVLYECKLPVGFEIDNNGRAETDNGYLRWFKKVPQNILTVHDVYFDIFETYNLLEKRS